MSRVLEAYLRTLVKKGTLTVAFPGRSIRFGDGTGPDLALRFADRRVAWELIRNPVLRFGEAYTDGRITVTRGTLFEIVALFSRAMREAGGRDLIRLLDRARDALSFFKRGNGPTASRSNVERHYDLDRRLYELFLDADLQYSCAYFERPDLDLEAAQRAKKRHISAKLALKPGQSVLDIGCGWGGLALFLAQSAGAGKVTGITLSHEQRDVAQARIREAGLDRSIEIRIEDYRQTRGPFDRIVSVGMLEHVGRKNLRAYFRTVAELLADDGVALVHTIGNSGIPWASNEWVDTYIFPGGYVPSLSEIADAVERAGLFLTDVEVLRLHYAETIARWRARFAANRDAARALYDERFCRMWDLYLCGAECSFRIEGAMNFQLQLTKRIDTLPLTRDYMGECEAELRHRDEAPPALQLAGE